MNFFNQYKDLFQVGKVGFIPQQRLRLDHDLFIDKPYIPAYTQQHSLNSKLRQLKKDYNQFQYQIKELQQLQQIPKRSDSRRKQYKQQNKFISPKIQQNKGRHHYSHIKQSSNIFNNNYNEDRNNMHPQLAKRQQNRERLSLQNSNLQSKDKQKYFSNQKLYEQKENKALMKNNLPMNRDQRAPSKIQESPQKKYLQQLRRQNQLNTNKYIKNQNLLQNKIYMQENNNVLKQSQINHVFNWKLDKINPYDKLQNLPQTTIPKYKIQNSSLQSPHLQKSFVNQNKNFMIRQHSNNEVKPNNRSKIVPQQKEYNVINTNSGAMQRRRLAKQNIDQRRERLKMILKSFY